jgi:arylsulfatase A
MRNHEKNAAVCRDLTDFSDFLPTFAELAGAKLPDLIKIDGHSFAPQLRGDNGTPREWAYVQIGEEFYVRSERWKLTGKGEFFDMKDAPWKQVPADANSAEAQAARAKLQAALDGLHNESTPVVPPRKKKKSAK